MYEIWGTEFYLSTSRVFSGAGTIEWACAELTQPPESDPNELPEGTEAGLAPSSGLLGSEQPTLHWRPLTCLQVNGALTLQISRSLILSVRFRDLMTLIKFHCWKVLFKVQPRCFLPKLVSLALHSSLPPARKAESEKRAGSEMWTGNAAAVAVTLSPARDAGP